MSTRQYDEQVGSEIIPEQLQRQADRADQLEFWRLEYTRRKFLKDIRNGTLDAEEISEAKEEVEQTAKSYIPILKLCDSYISNILKIYDNSCKVAFPTSWNWNIKNSEILYLSEAALVYYHNSISRDPKYIFDDLKFYPVSDIAREIAIHCHNSFKILRDIAFHYGYFIIDLLMYISAEKIIETLGRDGELQQPRDKFLKCNSDKFHKCRFNYRNLAGIPFFEPTRPGFLYLYYNISDNNFNIDEVIKALPGHIKRYKRNPVHGDKFEANIQVCIRMQKPHIEQEKIKNWCRYGLLKYKRWLFGSSSKREDLEITSVIYDRKSEQMAPEARASGLLLWDSINIDKKSFAECKRVNIRYASPNSQLYRDLHFTEYCIEHTDALSFADYQLRRVREQNI